MRNYPFNLNINAYQKKAKFLRKFEILPFFICSRIVEYKESSQHLASFTGVSCN